METCPNCGAVARPGAKFCTTCGTRLSGSAAAVATPPLPEPSTPDTATATATEANAPEASEQTNDWAWGAPGSSPASGDQDTSMWAPPPTPAPESAPVADQQAAPATASTTPADGSASTTGSMAERKSAEANEAEAASTASASATDPAGNGAAATTDVAATQSDDWTWPASPSPEANADTATSDGGPGAVDTSSALVDVPSAVGRYESSLDDDEGEQLSSWAARWNSETGTWNETDSTDADDAPHDATATEGIEGAPAGLTSPDAPVTDELPTLPDTGAIDRPSAAPGDAGFVGIEGAPGGDPEAIDEAESITTDAGTTAGADATDTAPEPSLDVLAAAATSNEPHDDPGATATSAELGASGPDELVGMEVAAQDASAETAIAAAPAPGETAADAGIAPVSEPLATARSGVASVGGNARARAAALLDEVRSLLPHLSSAGDSSGANASAILSPLQDVERTPVTYEALRAIVTEAEANPRDLYAMMDLGRHTGDILALLDERDRLRAAIDQALAAGNEPSQS